MPRRVYLDHNATAPLRPEAVAAMTAAFACAGNPSSVHGEGRAARKLVDDARRAVARLVGVAAEAVVFTSGGTEANDLALNGCGRLRVLVGATEHDSVLAAVPGREIVPVDGNGVIRRDALAEMLAADARPAIVSVMRANNETGTLQPVAEVAALAHRHGALVHCDAVQAAGRIPLDLAVLGVDYASLSAHKLGGPKGIGALIVLNGAPLAPRLRGGAQEGRRRAGTENVPAIAGFGAAAAVVESALAAEIDRLAALRDRLETGIRAAANDAVIHAAAAERLPNTSCVAMPGVSGETQVMAFDLAGFAVSAGSACSSGKVTVSHVLAAMGMAEIPARNSIRISLGTTTVAADIDAFVAAWTSLHRRHATRRAS